MVGNPDRVFLQRAFVGEVMVMIRIAVVSMLKVEAVDMIGERMAAWYFRLVVRVGHEERLQISACHITRYALIH